jgi:hypothetical protein
MEKPDSLERTKYHEWLEKFKNYLTPGCLVYDIGKSARYDYAQTFKEYNYLTIDKDANKKPYLILDIEDVRDLGGLDVPKAIICNGVVEQCENPFLLFQNLFGLLQPGGFMLIGTVLTGFPVYDNDRVRFTVRGIINLMKKYGDILENEVVYREGIVDPTYMYLIVKKHETLH